MIDYSFIRLVLNDFVQAKSGSNSNIPTLLYDGFIQQKLNETFVQTTNIDAGISFAGAIQVDLIDKCGVVVKNIDNNFYYTSFVDDNGKNQISFEFGMINKEFFTLPLHLKITDLINGNIYYSNSFLVTDYYSHLSSRFDYWNDGDVYKKSIRLTNFYYDNQANKLDLKSYTTTFGTQTSYRQIPTYLKKYKLDSIDFFVNERLCDLFCYEIIYLNNERVTISDFKSGERKGMTNFLEADFLANPQGQTNSFQLQIYPLFAPTTFYLPNGYVGNQTYVQSQATSGLYIDFNKPIFATTSYKADLYFNNALVATDNVAVISGNRLEFNNFGSYFTSNGIYSIVIPFSTIYSGVETWGGLDLGDYTIEIAIGEFDNTEFDNTEFLT